jgi:hypothetical protein
LSTHCTHCCEQWTGEVQKQVCTLRPPNSLLCPRCVPALELLVVARLIVLACCWLALCLCQRHARAACNTCSHVVCCRDSTRTARACARTRLCHAVVLLSLRRLPLLVLVNRACVCAGWVFARAQSVTWFFLRLIRRRLLRCVLAVSCSRSAIDGSLSGRRTCVVCCVLCYDFFFFFFRPRLCVTSFACFLLC